MNRRWFLKQFTAAVALVSLPIKWAAAKRRHKLYGDGVTDDTAALQALVDGEAVEMPDGSVQQVSAEGGTVWLPAGNFRVTQLPAAGVATEVLGVGEAYTTIKNYWS